VKSSQVVIIVNKNTPPLMKARANRLRKSHILVVGSELN
jgi:hypothetical protein